MTSRLLQVVALFSAVTGASAHAQSFTAISDEWRFQLLFPMLWAPDIKGDITVGADKYQVKIPFDEKISDLETGLIGEFYVTYGHFIAGLRSNYMRSKSEERTEGVKIPGGPTLVSPHKIESTTEEGTFDIIAGYQFDNGLILYGGGRRFGQSFALKLRSVEEDGLGFNEDLQLVDEWYTDAIIGANWRARLGERWNLAVTFDGNIAGDSETNIFGDIRFGYRISDLNNIWFGYRGSRIKLEPDTSGDRIVTDFRQHGPTIGWAFTF